MSALPLLNVDIIREISSHLRLPTCASLMRTSWFFYHEAAKAALQHPVYLSDTWDVGRFARFVCAENGTRLRYVREVHVGAHEHDMSEWDLQWLSDHIPRMSSLTTIGLTGEDSLDPTPELYAAIASLTSLRHLKIEGAGPMFVSLINSLRSKLQSADVMWLPYHRDGPDHEALRMQESMHPVQLLSNSCDTLETLTCQNWYTACNLPLLPTVYPKMREFSFNDDNYPSILPYVHAFPNLTRLCLEDINYGELVRVDRTGTLMTRLQEHRALNVKSQLDGVAWTKLEQLVGSITDLYILAPTCLIDRLELSGHTLRSQHHRSRDMLLETLPFARPKQLRITRGSGVLLLHPKNNLAVILQTPAGSRLENLVLNIELDQIHSEADIAAALISFSETLTHVCSLRRLRLRVWGSVLSRHIERVTRAEHSLKSFDAVAYARTLESSIPSLEDVAVAINGIREMEDIVATPAGMVEEDSLERYRGKMWEL